MYNYICVFFDFQWERSNRKQSTIFDTTHSHISCLVHSFTNVLFLLPTAAYTWQRNKMNLALIWALSKCSSLFLPLDSTLFFPLLFSLTKFIAFELFTFFCCSWFAYLLATFWFFIQVASRQLHNIVRPFCVVLIIVCVFRTPSKPKNETHNQSRSILFPFSHWKPQPNTEKETKCNSIRATAVV